MLKWDSRNSEWIELEVRKGKNKRAMRQSSTKPLPLIPIDGNLLSRSPDDCPIATTFVFADQIQEGIWSTCGRQRLVPSSIIGLL